MSNEIVITGTLNKLDKSTKPMFKQVLSNKISQYCYDGSNPKCRLYGGKKAIKLIHPNWVFGSSPSDWTNLHLTVRELR